MNIQNKKYKALLDTGSVKNYLPENVITDTGIHTKKLTDPKITETATGSLVKNEKEVDLKFYLFEDKNNIFSSKFYILPNPNKQPILGMRFLMENNAVINIPENYRKLDETEYEINIEPLKLESCEIEIMSKSKIYKIKETSEKIRALIRKSNQETPIIGTIPGIVHELGLTSTFDNVQKVYPVPLGIKSDGEAHLEQLIQNDIVEERDSNFISPAFVIRKKNGKIRLVVNYRYLNSITRKRHQYTPNMFDLLGRLKGAKVFSSIDLNQGYYQIKVTGKYVQKTGFRIMNRTFIFKKMPFGLCNAPATFQKVMQNMLRSVRNIIIYLDDVLIFNKNLEDHCLSLKQIFAIFKENNVSINLEKSKFAVTEIEFLGHKINEIGITPLITKINDIIFKAPKTKKQLQRILGLINLYRPFIPNISTKPFDLYELLKGNSRRLHWTSSNSNILDDLLKEIKKNPILHRPDLNTPFTL